MGPGKEGLGAIGEARVKISPRLNVCLLALSFQKDYFKVIIFSTYLSKRKLTLDIKIRTIHGLPTGSHGGETFLHFEDHRYGGNELIEVL
jgi:hypothetical protein